MSRGRMPVATLACLGVLLAAAGSHAAAPSFDGITIIELADEAGENAISGRGRVGAADTGNFIVTFVSAQGSYATLVSRRNSSRLCVAWAVEGSYTGASVTFGVAASIASMKTTTPKICQPFTLTHVGPGMVRVAASNSFHPREGPLSPAAETVTYSRERRVVAHVPLVALDWALPMFDRHSIKEVRLGPLPAIEAALAGRAKITVGALRRQTDFRKAFDAVLESPPGRAWVHGHVAAMEVLGWPWDALYGAWLAERMAPSTTAAFEEAVAQRYGRESLRYHMTAKPQLLWIYDLTGRQLVLNDPAPEAIADAARPDNCLATADDWLGGPSLVDINQDLGPWGCALIMVLTHDGRRGKVGEYRIEIVSGYVLALNHFFTRLEELRDARQEIERLESSRPKL